MLVFGPVPSRRLGSSLGVNNIPPKHCVYACPYCQAGRTTRLQLQRQSFYSPEHIAEAVQARVQALRRERQVVDYVSFVPDGEPTLDLHLGRAIELVQALGLRVAVITNAALLWREDVRADLCGADWVSLKVDAAWPRIWKRINRPLRWLSLDVVQHGMLEFVRQFRGILVTESMLVRGVNDGSAHVRDVAGFIARLGPDCAYLAAPTRAPAKAWVHVPRQPRLRRALALFRSRVRQTVLLAGADRNDFATAGDSAQDLLAILAVHPMRRADVERWLVRAGHNPALAEELLCQRLVTRKVHEGAEFFVVAAAAG